DSDGLLSRLGEVSRQGKGGTGNGVGAELHRLYWSERWPIRKIERHLKMSWRTIQKYLEAPAQTPAKRERSSKLDPFKGNIAEWIEKDPHVTGAVIEQRLQPLGYRGGHSILREYLQ